MIKELLAWAEGKGSYCLLESNGNDDRYGSYETLLAAGEAKGYNIPYGQAGYDMLCRLAEEGEWLFGYWNFELDIDSETSFESQFAGYFFKPEYLFNISDGTVKLMQGDRALLEEIQATAAECTPHFKNVRGTLEANVTRGEYLTAVEQIKQHISRGDVYELNYCFKYKGAGWKIHPPAVYERLNELTAAPFSGIIKHGDKYIISASPERFISRRNAVLTAQPMKGTAARSGNAAEDAANALQMSGDEKERSENIMIADLVRNDLTRVAKPGGVQVEKLCEVISYKQAHQMITTVRAELAAEATFSDVLQACFPMGSMTGAPKIRALEIIRAVEKEQRGSYSGCMGYINNSGDYDFNVLIRSIFYDAGRGTLYMGIGSAITWRCSAEAEYEECLLKAAALQKALSG